MDIKETAFLKVLADLSFPEKKVVMNPNDGFDLGLIVSDATVELHYGQSPATLETTTRPIFGNIYQKNECKVGTVELSTKAVQTMGSPKLVRLHLIHAEPYPKILIEPQ
jgi:hypothetical protein